MSENSGQRERLIKFKMYGHEFTLHTAAPEDEVEEILQLVRGQFDKIAPTASSTRTISDKLAILTCLNMAGEMVKLKRELESLKKASDENIVALTKRIESYL